MKPNQPDLQILQGLTLYRQLPERELTILYQWIADAFPYRFQRDWLLDDTDLAICNKARQIGLSHTSSALAVMWGAYLRETTCILSKGEREAKEVLRKARLHAHILEKAGSELAKVVKENETELVFASGGRILALPASAGRGYTGNAILDEFAYHERPEQVWEQASGTTSLTGRIRIISTPNGVGNMFHDLWTTAIEEDWSRYSFPIERAQADGYPVDMDRLWKRAAGDPRLFDQMYRCSFLNNLDQYIPTELLDAAFRRPIPSNDEGLAYGGLDIGETRDRTCLVIIRRNGDQRWLQHIESHKLTDDTLLDQLAEKAFKQYGVKRLCVDATGLGSFPAKRMRKTWGSRLEPVVFTQASKEDLATGLYDALTQGMALPKSYYQQGTDEMPLLREDIASIRRLLTAAGNVRFDAQRTKRGHADRAWSLMLAISGAGMQSAMFSALQARRTGSSS